jgi:quinol monooxygenase YgiN
MEDQVSWALELAIKPGELDAFKALLEEMVDDTRSAEPNTLAYRWFISDDGATVHSSETYADSEALVAHVNGFVAKWAERLLAAADVTRFTVYGNPSPAAKELLDGFGAAYLVPLSGFSR